MDLQQLRLNLKVESGTLAAKLQDHWTKLCQDWGGDCGLGSVLLKWIMAYVLKLFRSFAWLGMVQFHITCREYSSTRSDGASARIVYDYFDALSKEFWLSKGSPCKNGFKSGVTYVLSLGRHVEWLNCKVWFSMCKEFSLVSSLYKLNRSTWLDIAWCLVVISWLTSKSPQTWRRLKNLILTTLTLEIGFLQEQKECWKRTP